MNSRWNKNEILNWIESQTDDAAFYQTIELNDGLIISGRVDTLQRIQQMDLPKDLSGFSVLDVGCNSGSLCFEAKKRGASKVVGIDVSDVRLNQARTIADILDLNIEFYNKDLFTLSDLEQFDIVFCIAVLTEVTDIIKGLEILKSLTKRFLYLEIALTNPVSERLTSNIVKNLESISKCFPNLKRLVRLKENFGIAKLRRIDSRTKKGWSLVPSRNFIESILTDSFDIFNLGQSQRYTLLKLTKK